MNKITAPHVRSDATAGKMMIDVLLAAMPLGVFSFVNYGIRPVYILLIAILSAMVCEAICCMMRRRPLRSALDGTAAVTGLLIGLMMSPMVDYWVPMVGAAFAIFVAKAPFGGTGRNVFNPAAAGVALLTFCFPDKMFTYPAISHIPLPTDPIIPEGTVITELSLAAQLQAGATPTQSPLHLLLGDFSGPIGATAALILLAFMGYLLVHRTISAWVVLPYMITCLITAWVFPLGGMNPTYNTLSQLLTGYVLFAGVFLINDPVTTPRFWLGRIFYGISAAMLVMLMQRIGRFEAGTCYAILLMNAFAPIIDRWSWHGWHRLTRRLRIRKEVKAYE